MALIASTNTTDGNKTTPAITTTGAKLIVACVQNYTASATFTDSKGNIWVELTAQNSTGPIVERIFYCINPIVGTGHTFTAQGSLDHYAGCVILAFDDALVYVGESHAGAVATTQAPGNISIPNAGLFVTGSVTAAAPATIDSGFTITGFGVFNTYYRGTAAYKFKATAGNENPLWTFTYADPNGNAACMAAFATAPINITTASLPNGVAGDEYNQTLLATGGYGALTWSLTGGSLPTGLSLSAAGVISGTVTAPDAVYSFTVSAADAGGGSDTQALTITVSPYAGPPRFPTPNLTGILWERFHALPTDYAAVTIGHTYEDEGRSFNETTSTPAKRWEVGFSGLSFDEMMVFEVFFESVRLTQTFTFRDKWAVIHSGVRVEAYERNHSAHMSWRYDVRFTLCKYP